jgi:hypothetical protein
MRNLARYNVPLQVLLMLEGFFAPTRVAKCTSVKISTAVFSFASCSETFIYRINKSKVSKLIALHVKNTYCGLSSIIKYSSYRKYISNVNDKS